MLFVSVGCDPPAVLDGHRKIKDNKKTEGEEVFLFLCTPLLKKKDIPRIDDGCTCSATCSCVEIHLACTLGHELYL